MTDLLSKSLSESRQHAFRKRHINQAVFSAKRMWSGGLAGRAPFLHDSPEETLEKPSSTKLWL